MEEAGSVNGGSGRGNTVFWWGEAPERLYDFDGVASKISPAFGQPNTLGDLSDVACVYRYLY